MSLYYLDPLYWVSVDLVWDAINTIDNDTGLSR